MSKTRTILTLDTEDKDWLVSTAKKQDVPMAEVIRRAIHLYRDAETNKPSGFKRLLTETKGVWTEGDGLKYQEKIRNEWNKRP